MCLTAASKNLKMFSCLKPLKRFIISEFLLTLGLIQGLMQL